MVQKASDGNIWLWRAACWLLIGPLKVLFRLRVTGRANVPKEGPVVLVSNHNSYLDPLLLSVACPRRIEFMAKKELWDYPVLKQLLRGLFVFPVRRGAPDRQALREALARLAAGRVVGVFPEGTRYREDGVGPGFPGAALMALRGRAPLLPVAITGSDRIWPEGRRLPRFPRISLAFGAAMDVDLGQHRRTAVETATRAIMKEIAILEGTSKWR